MRQPWASLLVRGKKLVEVRGWRPPEDLGGFFIHASKVRDFEACDRLGLRWDVLPSGVIIGVVRLAGVIEYSGPGDFEAAAGLHLVDKWWGRFPCFGWVVSEPRPVGFVKACGRLGLWDFTFPTDL